MVTLDFDPNSQVGNLFADVKNAYLKTGKMEEEFYKEVNEGYCSSQFVPICSNDITKIESSEVFEFAYAHKDYHYYLAKHGYPLPFGMNDYNPDTTIDDILRGEIDATVDKFITEVILEGLVPKTDEYIYKLSKKIYDWGVGRFAESENCPVGILDWKALSQGCGKCAETSAVIYYAAQRGGLEPQFAELYEADPTIENYYKFGAIKDTNIGIGDIHVFVAVPMADNKLLHIDVTQKRFDADYKYPMLMSPRQFALVYYNNLQSSLLKNSNYSELMRISRECMEVGGGDETCYENYFWPLIMKVLINKADSEDLIALNAIMKEISDSQNPYLFSLPAIANMSSLIRAGKESVFLELLENKELSSHIIDFSKKDPKRSSYIALRAVFQLYRLSDMLGQLTSSQIPSQQASIEFLIEKLNKNILDILKFSILQNPCSASAWGTLEFLLKKADEIVPYELFSTFVEKYPTASLGYYLKTKYGLEYAYTLDIEAADPILKAVEESINNFVSLETGGSWVKFKELIYRGLLAACRNKHNETVAYFEQAQKILPSDLNPVGFYLDSAYYYFRKGDVKNAEVMLKKIYEKEPETGSSHLYEFVIGSINTTFKIGVVGSRGPYEKLNRMPFHQNLTYLEKLLDVISEQNGITDKVKRYYGVLYAVSLLLDDTKLTNRLKMKARSGFSQDIFEIIVNFLSDISKNSWKMTTEELEKGNGRQYQPDKLIETLSRDIDPNRYPNFADFLVLAVKLKLMQNNIKAAVKFIRIASKYEATSALFKEQVAMEFIADCFDYCFKKGKKPDVKMLKRALDTAEVALYLEGEQGTDVQTEIANGLGPLIGKCKAAKLYKEEKRVEKLKEKLKRF